MKLTGGPAFPTGTGWNHAGDWVGGGDDGMTLRDYFAAKAMAAIMADPNVNLSADKIAEWAYKQADAILKAREA